MATHKFTSGSEQVTLNFRNLPTPMVEWKGTAKDLHRIIFDACMNEANAAPVTPVSGNGTEPPDHVIDVAVARIAQELDWHLPDTDLIEFGVTVYKEALRLAGAASHNGQGWVSVDVKPTAEQIAAHNGWFQVANKKTKRQDIAKYLKGEFMGHALQFDEVTHWQPLPTPPQEEAK